MTASYDKAHQVSSSNAAKKRQAMFDRYDELRDIGETPLLACERLGIKPANLSRTAYRWDRKDIGNELAAYVAQDKKRR